MARQFFEILMPLKTGYGKHHSSKPKEADGPDYSKPLVRRLMGNKGSRRASPVFVVLGEKYGKRK
mgnify:CR=1 FL=1